MAPLPDSTLKCFLTSLIKRTASKTPASSMSDNKAAAVVARAQSLFSRSDSTKLADPASGITPFDQVPNKAIFALFGLIGVSFVVTGIWFFFWAKNGGFYYTDHDWDDYKTTVLRRKGPNGTTLSGATATTDLGGGSVVHGEKRSIWGRRKKGAKRYKDFEDDESSQMTSSLGGSELGSEMSELKRQAKQEKKNRKKKGKESSLHDEDVERGLTHEEEMDAGVRDAVRAYRHEKPARVGGINKPSDASAWDGSTNDNSTTAASELLSNRERTPTTTPVKIKKERNDNYTGGNGGIRKVVSTSEGGSNFWSRSSISKKDKEQDRIQAEARKLQEKGRAAQRRDFSFSVGDDSTVVSEETERSARREERERRRANRSPSKKVPGSYYEESEVGSAVSGHTGTKSYHHPIPGLSPGGGAGDYAEERRKKRAGGGGYRRE